MKRIHLLLFSLLAASCSIKEDRSSCPCILRLDFPELVSGQEQFLLSVNRGGECIISELLVPGETGGVCELEVPKDELFVNVWSEESFEYVADGALQIPLGDDCPAVKMFSASLDTRDCEARTLNVDMSKNYCQLSIVFAGEGGSLGGLVSGVGGTIDGYSADGRPREGDFFHFNTVGEGNQDAFRLMLPRQTDASLKLDIFSGSGLLKSFALGNYLKASGYDWNAKDLSDATVFVDFAGTQIEISVSGWEDTHSFDIVL